MLTEASVSLRDFWPSCPTNVNDFYMKNNKDRLAEQRQNLGFYIHIYFSYNYALLHDSWSLISLVMNATFNDLL
jgi:hypothetical protein